jgi:flagellar motor switch protein FliN/FliY
MNEPKPSPPAPPETPETPDARADAVSADGPAPASSEAEQMVKAALAQAEASLDAMKGQVGDAKPVALPELGSAAAEATPNSIELLHDVDLHVMVELGRTQMMVEDVLRLTQGSVVELDKLAGDPVDVYVNNRLVARGEVLVLNDNFCIRISEIVANLEEQATAAATAEQEASAS